MTAYMVSQSGETFLTQRYML